MLTDPGAEKVFATAHERAIVAAMAYLHRHAGYTRVHNPIIGLKDLQRAPGLVGRPFVVAESRTELHHL